MKMFLKSIKYLGDDIGNDLSFKFKVDGFSGNFKSVDWVPVNKLNAGEEIKIDLVIFNSHENKRAINIVIDIIENDFFSNDVVSYSQSIPLNLNNWSQSEKIYVSLSDGGSTANFQFDLLIEDLKSLFFQKLWNNHPGGGVFPCDRSTFSDQCAIRMGVALERSGIETSSFDQMYPNRRCYRNFNHNPGHILAAQELASWIDRKNIFGKYKKIIPNNYPKESGIVFIKNGWGHTDHIDVWNGSALKGGDSSFLPLGEEVWFWKV